MRRSLALLALLVLAGCAPRELPPQLAHTAAPAYKLTERDLITTQYRVTPPTGWRVIAGPAESPYTFQFVAPDNTALIVVSDRRITDLPQPSAAPPEDLTSAAGTAQAAGKTIHLAIVAPDAALSALMSTFDSVRDSIH